MGVYVTARLKDDSHATMAEFAQEWLGKVIHEDMVTVYREVYQRYIEADRAEQTLCFAWYNVVSKHALWSLDPTWWDHRGEKGLSITLGKVTRVPGDLAPLFDEYSGDVPEEHWAAVAEWYGCKRFRADMVASMSYG
jgi:hypothetical protein